MISVVCITYNHRPYIRKVLEGIVNQKVNVPFEVIVHDDASTDGTQEIIREYANRYPELIKPILQEFNQTSLGKNVRKEFVHPMIKGKYYAWTEGDDYWINYNKLQKQFDFMESNPECVLCYHNAINYSPNDDTNELLIKGAVSGYLNDEGIILLKKGNYPTTSVFARTKDVLSMPEGFWKAPIGDHVLRLYLSTVGKVYYMEKVWAVRTYMHSSSWTYKMQNIEKYNDYCAKYMHFLEYFNEYSNGRFKKYIQSVCNLNYIRKNLIEASPITCETWISKAKRFYDANFKTSSLYKVNDLIVDGLRYCSDYDKYIYDNMIKNISGRLYIYGAGKEARFKRQVAAFCGFQTESFVVSSMLDNETKVDFLDVKELSTISFNKEDAIWLGLDREHKQQVIPLLESRGLRYFEI